LTDGTPLVQKDGNPENLSGEFSNANTMVDRASISMHNYGKTTSAQEQPTQFFSVPSESFSDKKRSRTILYSVITVVVLAGAGIGIWLHLKNVSTSAYAPPVEVIKSVEAKKAASPLTDEQSNQIKKEVNDFLQSWRNAIEKRDIDAQMRHYAKTVETFYRDSGKDQNSVRAERLKAIERFDTLSLDLTNINVVPESDRFASVTFDKTWAFRGKERFSSGSVQQEMGLVKSDGRWFIVIEKDLQIYNLNNRQAPTAANNNNTNQ
jgi:hypothetical protein